MAAGIDPSRLPRFRATPAVHAPLPSSAQRPPDDIGSEDLALDADELRALQIFHRSFNLPGLRLGLVNPVCRDDYYPEDFEEEEGAVALQHQARATSSLLEQAQALLGEMGIEEDVAPEVGAPQRMPRASAMPVRGEVKPRSAGARRPGAR